MFKYILLFLSVFFLEAEEIAIATIVAGNDYEKLVQQGTKTKIEYAKKQKYKLVIQKSVLDPSRPIPWSKILLIANILEDSKVDWVFWTDADSLIMNYEKRLEDFLDDRYDLILSQDFNGINTGQFFIKNSTWSKQFLRDVYSHKDLIHHPNWEQSAIIREYNQNEKVRLKTKICSQNDFNSYPLSFISMTNLGIYNFGDFLIHFPSIRGENLKNEMGSYFKIRITK